jgi:sec-independent protein translocase protein TatA
MHISISKLLLIFTIIVVLFGTKKLRNFGEDFGEALRSFRKAMTEPEDSPPTTSPAASGRQEPQGIVEEQARSSSSDPHKT